jgi:hypothetical protein
MYSLSQRRKLMKDLVNALVDCDTTADELQVMSFDATGPLFSALESKIQAMDEAAAEAHCEDFADEYRPDSIGDMIHTEATP